MQNTAKLLTDAAYSFGLITSDTSSTYDVKQFVDLTNEYNDKPNLILFASFEPGFDFITQNSSYLKEKFNLFKIFTNTIMDDAQTENFKAVVSIKRDFDALAKILQTANYALSVVANIGLYYHWYVPFFKLNSSKPVVCIDKDMTTSVHCEDLEILKRNFEDSMERAIFERDCEEYMIDSCDGLITNLGGEFFRETVEKRTKNAFFYMPLRDKRFYRFQNKDFVESPIRLCYAGTFFPHSYDRLFGSEGVIHNLLMEMDLGSIMVDLYPADSDSDLGCYEELPNVSVKKTMKIYDLLPIIQACDFGIILNDFRRIDEKLVKPRKYLFPTKIFTYLSAGLPIIINKEYEAAKEFLLSNGVAIAVGLDELGRLHEIIRECDYATMKKNVAKFQENYSLQTKQEELGDFLLRCIS